MQKAIKWVLKSSSFLVLQEECKRFKSVCRSKTFRACVLFSFSVCLDKLLRSDILVEPLLKEHECALEPSCWGGLMSCECEGAAQCRVSFTEVLLCSAKLPSRIHLHWTFVYSTRWDCLLRPRSVPCPVFLLLTIIKFLCRITGGISGELKKKKKHNHLSPELIVTIWMHNAHS